MKIPPSIYRYWLAMNATAFDSMITSLVMYCAPAGIHQAAADLGYSVPALSLQQFILVGLSSFGWAILQYLHAHPLSALLPAGPPPVDHEDALDRINQSLTPKTGYGGNATEVHSAEPTAIPAISTEHKTP